MNQPPLKSRAFQILSEHIPNQIFILRKYLFTKNERCFALNMSYFDQILSARVFTTLYTFKYNKFTPLSNGEN